MGQRLFFLHDGRTSNAIEAMPDRSEANQVARTFNSLSPSQMQDILNFLRSL